MNAEPTTHPLIDAVLEALACRDRALHVPRADLRLTAVPIVPLGGGDGQLYVTVADGGNVVAELRVRVELL